MTILSIETSCDETAVSILACHGDRVRVLGNALSSQIEIHAKYGGVFPALAKRAHAEKIVTLLAEALEQAGMLKENVIEIPDERRKEIDMLCVHEEGLASRIAAFVEEHMIPDITHIAVTAGPGLEPALWVGINTATALGILWNKPVHPVNHMEGHVISALLRREADVHSYKLEPLSFPVLSLLVSGGHTELVLIKSPLSYTKIGETKDDAVGEAFDKTARILGLPYPGGPKISGLAKEAREANLDTPYRLPRPMLHSDTFDFSYSGLKTAVLYLVRDLEKNNTESLDDMNTVKQIAREFEEAAIEVLTAKTARAVETCGARTLLVGGGVAANSYLREELKKKIEERYNIAVHFPAKDLSTDNSIMIGVSLYYGMMHGKNTPADIIRANGNLSIE